MQKPIFIKRIRRLPYPGQIDVQVGEWVEEEQTVARLDYIPGRLQKFDAAKQIAVAPSELQQAMLCATGAAVEVGDPVAMSYRFGECRVATSPYRGFIGLVSRHLGYVYVREPIPVGSNQPVELDIAKELDLLPIMANSSLLVRIGTTVALDQPLAVRKSTPQSRYVRSPVYGKVTHISEGKVTITPLHARTELTAFLAGKVVDVVPGEQVVIQAFAHVISGVYGIGGETGGPIYIAAGPDEMLAPSAVDARWRGKVVVAGATASNELLQAAIEAEAAAVVLGYLPFVQLQELTGEQSLVGMTGDEDLGLTVILTDGFLPCHMDQQVYQALQALSGRYAAVNGTTHIRAGAIRPEIIVCERDWPTEMETVAREPELREGMLVKLLREPARGSMGQIVELPWQQQAVASGARLPVAKVLVGSEVLVVPISNLSPVNEGGAIHG